MNKRVVTGIIFTAAMLLILVPAFRFPAVTAAFMYILAFFCTMEYARAILRKHPKISLPVMLGGTLITVTPVLAWLPYRGLREGWNLLTMADGPIDEYWRTDFVWLVFIALGVVLLFALIYSIVTVLVQVLQRGPAILPDSLASLSAIPYISFPFSFAIIFLFAVPNGYRWLLLAFILPWITDVAAYYAGTYFGRRKFLKFISPNKTLEGFFGGILGSIMFSLLYFIIFMRGPQPLKPGAGAVILYGFITGFVIGIVSQAGDWFASAIKRYTERKDFGKLLPGHGGLLDRMDSVLFSLPFILIISIFYSLF